MFIKREVFEKVGLLPTEYFMYFEDADCCTRILERGYKIIYNLRSVIYHKVSSASGGDDSPFTLQWMTYNGSTEEYIFQKNKILKIKIMNKGLKDYLHEYIRNFKSLEVKCQGKYCMKKILFISEYPNCVNIKEGMIQRVKNIDDVFSQHNRLYLNISFKKNFKSQSIKINNRVEYKKINYFIHSKYIKNIFKEYQYIYVHSIYNYSKIKGYFHKKNVIILDVHGVVPEEIYYNNNKLKYLFYNKIEKEAFKRSNYQIFVTKSMENHFLKKYNKINGIIYPILPSNLSKENTKQNNLEVDNIKKYLKISDEDIIYIYSGNSQKWQNTDIMFSTISNLKNDKYKFIILSKDIEIIKQKINTYNINKKNIILDNVQPNELWKYYSIANYGFILRDDHLLNKVACPTKLVEYMFYGIIPIVKYEDIGDFQKYGYEKINVSKISNNMKPLKSKINNEIIKGIYQANKGDIIKQLIK